MLGRENFVFFNWAFAPKIIVHRHPNNRYFFIAEVIEQTIYKIVLNFVSTITSGSKLKKLIIILGREQLHKDSQLYNFLFKSIDRKKFDVQFDPSDELSIIHERVKSFGNHFKFGRKYAESIYSKLLKLQFILRYQDWTLSYFSLYKPSFRDFEYRKTVLTHFLFKLSKDQEVIIIGRSAGAILATQLADSFQIKKVICLGYPFKHPEKAEEKYRTEHLAKLKTQTIIFQGKQDPYGNIELGKQYCISEKIKIIEVATDHEFVRAPETLKLIQTFIYKELLSF
jgi:hypothetical protein